MRQQYLQIHLNIQGESGSRGFPSFLPVNIIDERGHVLSTGTVSTVRPTQLLYERDKAPLFVRLALPNGISETRPLQKTDHTWREREEVTFNIGNDAEESAWMAWSAVRLDMKQQGEALMDQPSMKGAWFQLWEKIPDSLLWRQIYMSEQLSALPHSQNAIQLELRCSTHPRALVARLDNDIPQVVSLPRMQTSVLVTSLRTLSGVLTPRVIVGSYSPNAEAIMEFLRAGRLGSVESMLDPGNELAHQLLWDKIIDPIAATAAAYYLLRKRDWDRLPSQWLDNLSFWNKDIPDAKLIHAASQIERGMPMAKACKLASETLSSFLENGIPLFAEASNLLSDLLALAEKAEEPLEVHTARVLRMMVASSHQSGLSFGFAGKSPNKPLPAHKAFESKKLRREFARQIVDLTEAKIVKPPSNKLNAKRSRRQMHVATKIMGPLLPSPQSTVSGNTAKTLFLQSILDEIAWVPR